MTAPSPAERARTLLARARIATLTTFRAHPPLRCATTLVTVSVDDAGRPVVVLARDNPAVDQLLLRPLATLRVAPDGKGPLVLHGAARRAPDHDHPSGQLAFRLEVGALRLLDGTGPVDPVSYTVAAPDPLRSEAPQVLRHLEKGHASELLACVRAHVDPHAEWVVPTDLDRYGLEVTVLDGGGVTRHRMAFPEPVDGLGQLQTGLRTLLTCRCHPT
jgi:hypothetical protein